MFRKDKFISLNSPDGDRPIKIVLSLEKAVELCLAYKSQPRYIGQPDSVGKIIKPEFVFDEEKSEYYWKDELERLPEEGEYHFIVDGLGYYPGNDYPIIKPGGWFHYTEITQFPTMTSLMSCRMNEDGCYKYPKSSSRIYQKGKHFTMYAKEVFKLN